MPYRSILTGPDGQVTGYLGLDFAVNPIHDNQPDLCWENGRLPLSRFVASPRRSSSCAAR
jgi:hypothetical protein